MIKYIGLYFFILILIRDVQLNVSVYCIFSVVMIFSSPDILDKPVLLFSNHCDKKKTTLVVVDEHIKIHEKWYS